MQDLYTRMASGQSAMGSDQRAANVCRKQQADPQRKKRGIGLAFESFAVAERQMNRLLAHIIHA